MDAGIACWDAKRAYDTVRPVTAIRHLFQGKTIVTWGGPYLGPRLIEGETWSPYQIATVVTPPFPEYVSGHSTFSAAEVLRSFTRSDKVGGSVTLAAGSSLAAPGSAPKRSVRLYWRTFSDAVRDAGMSRFYGGIHFKAGNLEGQALGQRVGARVWKRSLQYFRRK